VEGIETVDPDVDWAAKEGMPCGMVSQVYRAISLIMGSIGRRIHIDDVCINLLF
jgi:hypothetical protein